MVPLLAKNAVKIKCGFSDARMTGNYEYAYALGYLSGKLGIVKEEDIKDITALKSTIAEKLKNYEAADDREKRLVEIFLEYEPLPDTDEQMIELYNEGLKDKNI